MELDLWSIERAHYAQGCKVICGVDEAGRGPLAGPVCAAAVILPPDLEIPGLNDSKKLSDAKRRALFDVITEQAVAYGICMVDEKRIDEINILQATFEAMQGALDQLTVRPELALIDGNRARDFGLPVETIIGGDGKSANIAAASILAKVTRDRYMCQLDKEYPQYQLAKHKGYGTKLHYELIRQYGIQPFYRKSFLKKLGY